MGAFNGQGWLQLGELALAFVLSALIGVEREIRQKSAGVRTYTLVGVAAALFMLVSKYGFNDVLRPQVVVDPSRIAAQVVSGIGFIGGGVIFMRRDIVRGLTTAASVWLTAALGMACGAGLPALAIATTIGHFVIMFGFPKIISRLPASRKNGTVLRLVYEDGRGLLRAILLCCTRCRFAIEQVRLSTHPSDQRPSAVTLFMQVKGKRPISRLVEKLSEIDGVWEVETTEDDGLE
ncbi:MgtC/SapB family protein [Gluconacetobacter sacchari]|uniref:Protein MgtC n=2 Tax=Gluconacetobacter sacchari TaxID=92759 RepID=A0A7W4NQC1_9PROT|nr:MgtC/SapB family protein [Gluconacetobacter sacchari]MBB2159808.1 MgtC/SapB family protein [Gluconacetobacter sacchari]GBQ21803.1 cation transporter MgtC/SapB [Gluconacetobacter sacchari DSM 12717]